MVRWAPAGCGCCAAVLAVRWHEVCGQQAFCLSTPNWPCRCLLLDVIACAGDSTSAVASEQQVASALEAAPSLSHGPAELVARLPGALVVSSLTHEGIPHLQATIIDLFSTQAAMDAAAAAAAASGSAGQEAGAAAATPAAALAPQAAGAGHVPAGPAVGGAGLAKPGGQGVVVIGPRFDD